jgi:uncharacterized iron-regulated protein
MEDAKSPRSCRTAPAAVISLLLAGILVAGCAPGGDSREAGSSALADSVLTNAARHVIHPTYERLHTEARSLLVAARAFQQRPNADNLARARRAWREARAAWESAEAFLFGPVVTEDFDSAIDSWPVNEADLKQVLAGSDSLSAKRVSSLGDTEKGFHAIEYLLFGKRGRQTVSALTGRRIDYLVAAVRHLEQTTDKLAQTWAPGANNYGQTFVTAGASDNRTFYNKGSALRQLVISMAALAKELANEKLGAPLKAKSARRVESRFSGNSLADFKNNVAGLRHLYTGDYRGHAGPGLDEIVKAKKPKLDERFRRELENARGSLDQIPDPFRTAATEAPEAVRRARSAARRLARTLEEDIKPLVIAV